MYVLMYVCVLLYYAKIMWAAVCSWKQENAKFPSVKLQHTHR